MCGVLLTYDCVLPVLLHFFPHRSGVSMMPSRLLLACPPLAPRSQQPQHQPRYEQRKQQMWSEGSKQDQGSRVSSCLLLHKRVRQLVWSVVALLVLSRAGLPWVPQSKARHTCECRSVHQQAPAIGVLLCACGVSVEGVL
jgi:hypothetical protein